MFGRNTGGGIRGASGRERRLVREVIINIRPRRLSSPDGLG